MSKTKVRKKRMNATVRSWMIQQFVWIGVSFTINFALLMVLPFYIAFPLSFVVFVAVTRLIQRNYRNVGGRLGSLGIAFKEHQRWTIAAWCVA